MDILFGVLAGLAWGLAAALVNKLIIQQSLKKNSTQAVLRGNALRMIVDVIALGVVFLLRNVLPFSFAAAIISTAAAMSIGVIIFSFAAVRNK